MSYKVFFSSPPNRKNLRFRMKTPGYWGFFWLGVCWVCRRKNFGKIFFIHWISPFNFGFLHSCVCMCIEPYPIQLILLCLTIFLCILIFISSTIPTYSMDEYGYWFFCLFNCKLEEFEKLHMDQQGNSRSKRKVWFF